MIMTTLSWQRPAALAAIAGLGVATPAMSAAGAASQPAAPSTVDEAIWCRSLIDPIVEKLSEADTNEERVREFQARGLNVLQSEKPCVEQMRQFLKNVDISGLPVAYKYNRRTDPYLQRGYCEAQTDGEKPQIFCSRVIAVKIVINMREYAQPLRYYLTLGDHCDRKVCKLTIWADR